MTGQNSARGEDEGNPQIPPGFTVCRLEEEARVEDRSHQGRVKGRYKEGMGAKSLALEMETVAAALQGGLRIEE
ncbi:unnamed protein product [Linum trigynum]|uniref:Uncharacterized protein n=1 Tax=Linum trigynum TaxID=586398 RepID=A0AAV2EAH9_9ROSI